MIGFLINLVLDHKLPKEAKELCLQKIKELEEQLHRPQQPALTVAPIQTPYTIQQQMHHQQQAQTVPVVAQTAAAAKALADRQAMIDGAVSGKQEGNSPRKLHGHL